MEARLVSQPAPGDLETVRAFVNTFDAEDGTDDVDTPEKLVAWLGEHDLVPAGTRATRADVGRATELREAFREILLGHHGAYDTDPEAFVTLQRVSERVRVEVRFGPDGIARATPARQGVDWALGRLLAIVAHAQSDGTWERLKSCPADDCRFAFYDKSRNRSAVWCDMAVCGNRAKVRNYRVRHQATA